MSKKLHAIVESRGFNVFIIILIVLAAVTVGLSTFPSVTKRWGGVIEVTDGIILAFFTVEVVLRMGAQGKRPWRYFLDPWNLFDFMIVAACFLPLHNNSVLVLRVVRLLRVLRIVRALPRLRLIISGFVKSIASVGYVAALLMLQFYIFAVIGVTSFASVDPDHFGHLGRTFLTLFQVITLENWPDVMAPVKAAYPISGVLYFVIFIVSGTMVIMNLFVGVIVSSMSEAVQDVKNDGGPAGEPVPDDNLVRDLAKTIAGLRGDIAELNARLNSLDGRKSSEGQK